MTAFDNRFWGVRRLKFSVPGETDLRAQVELYLNWRLIALDDTGILLCRPTTAAYTPRIADLVIIEGILMQIWLEHRAPDV